MTTLAMDFMNLSRKSSAMESAVSALFHTLRANEIKTEAQFKVAIKEVFEENKWSQRKGRPMKGSKLKPAPQVVTVYVSRFNAAYKLKLDVLSFETEYAMRQAVAEKRRAAHAKGAEKAPELQGVQLSAKKQLIGSMFHDLPTLWEELPEDTAALMLKELQKVYTKFVKSAPPDLKLVA